MTAPTAAAIAAHRAAYDAFQVAPDGEPALQAEDAYDAASGALVATVCGSREEALALLVHLRWWLAEEAEFREHHQPAYGISEARVVDLEARLETACESAGCFSTSEATKCESGQALARPIPQGPITGSAGGAA